MEYNTGNYEKHMTKNPLKRYMVLQLNRTILNMVNEVVNSDQDRSKRACLLDAGCGEGFITGLLKANVNNLDITGLEYTEEALQIARARNPEITFIQGDILKMPFDSDSFDIVLCSEVLEHLEKPAAALNELLRVAKKELILTVPHEPWFCMGNMLVLKNVTRFGNPIDHINHWTNSGFASFLKSHSSVKWDLNKSFPWTVARCDLYDTESQG